MTENSKWFIILVLFAIVGCAEEKVIHPQITSVKMHEKEIEVCFDPVLNTTDEYIVKFLFQTKTEKYFKGNTAVKGDNKSNCKKIEIASLIDPTLSSDKQERRDLLENHIVKGNIESVTISLNFNILKQVFSKEFNKL